MRTIYLTDRSRIVTREECPRKRFITYDYETGFSVAGVQRKEMGLPLLNGDELHVAHARLLGGLSADKVVEQIIASYRTRVEARGVFGEGDSEALITEQSMMLSAMLLAFEKEWMPRILDEYEVLSIEKPQQYELAPGLVMSLREDTSLRRFGDGMRVTLDYKSVPYITDDFAKRMERSRQTSLYVLAAQAIYDEPVEIAYLATAKGTRRKDTAKSSPFFGQRIQASPYLYGYMLKGGVGTVYQSAYTPKKGFEKFRTYEEMPISEWVDYLWTHERETVKEQFSFVPPFSQTPGEMERIRKQVIFEELDYLKKVEQYYALYNKGIRDGNDALLSQAQEFLDNIAAPMRDEVCYKYGQDNVCSCFNICHNDGALDRVLEDGEFEPREPHHTTELMEAA